MGVLGKTGVERLDAEIGAELEKIRNLSVEDLEQIYGGNVPGDTREEYSMDPSDINRSIYGALY